MKRKTISILICICIAAAAAAVFTGCGTEVTADISAYGGSGIVICGLKSKTFKVTPNQLKDMECVKETAEGKSEKAGKVKAAGPLLETFVGEYGHKQTDFSEVTFKARDGYTTVLDKEFLKSHQTIVMSIADGNKALKKDEAPMRLLIPGAASMYWTKMIREIDFE